MHEQRPQEIRAGAPPSQGGDGTFALKKKFPGETAPTPLPTPQVPGTRAKSPRRFIIPLVILTCLVGGIAYVAQNLPNWRSRSGGPRGPGPEPAGGKELLKFSEFLRDANPEVNIFHARWDQDPKRPIYAAEIEKGAKGQFDFLFFNPLDQPVQLAVQESSCDCSRVSFTLVPVAGVQDYRVKQPDQSVLGELLAKHGAAWTKLSDEKEKKGDDKIVGAVPPNAAGVVRVAWQNRKNEGDSLNLRITLWAQAENAQAKTRQYVVLHVPTLVVAPIQFHSSSRHIGEARLSGTKTEFECWSATRADPKLTLRAADDPLFDWQLTKLTPQECKELEERLIKARNTRVKAAYRVSVVVYEERNGKQLDQGSFARQPPLLLDGEPLESPGTRVEGTVRGDVEVRGEVKNGFVESGQVRFGEFKTSDGTNAQLTLRTEPGVTLEVMDKAPPYLEVKLTEGKQGPDKRKSWLLNVVVPRQVPSGPLPPDSAVILRKTAQGAPPRQIRIPLLGNAVQR